MSLQHQCIDSPFLLSSLPAHQQGARDIGGAAGILCPSVHQQQALRLDRHIGLRHGLVMHDGAMLLVCRNGVEAKAFKVGKLHTQLGQLGIYRHLCLATTGHCLLQPSQPLHQRYAVLQHSLLHSANFTVIFPRFHRRNWAGSHQALAPLLVVAYGGDGRISKRREHYLARSLAQSILYLRIVCHHYIHLVQIGSNISRYLAAVAEEGGRLATDEAIAHKHRIAVYIAATQIKQPRHLVQLTDKYLGAAHTLHLVHQATGLAPRIFAGPHQRLNPDRLGRQ